MSKNKSGGKAKPATQPIQMKSDSNTVSTVKADDSEVVTLNLQPYLLPIAIVVNAIIIAIAILLAGRGTVATNTVTDTNTVDNAIVDETDLNTTETTTYVGDSPYLGNKETAKIAIVEFSDYECPFCQRHHNDVYPEIVANYVETDKAIYVYKNYIAVPSHNPAATTEAYAALCAKELGGNSNPKYFQMADLIYTNTLVNGGGLPADKSIRTLAETIGINPDQMQSCIDSAKYAAVMTTDEEAALSAGIQGTPGFVVGVLKDDGTVEGKIIAGAYPYEEFQRIADEMLAR